MDCQIDIRPICYQEFGYADIYFIKNILFKYVTFHEQEKSYLTSIEEKSIEQIKFDLETLKNRSNKANLNKAISLLVTAVMVGCIFTTVFAPTMYGNPEDHKGPVTATMIISILVFVLTGLYSTTTLSVGNNYDDSFNPGGGGMPIGFAHAAIILLTPFYVSFYTFYKNSGLDKQIKEIEESITARETKTREFYLCVGKSLEKALKLFVAEQFKIELTELDDLKALEEALGTFSKIGLSVLNNLEENKKLLFNIQNII